MKTTMNQTMIIMKKNKTSNKINDSLYHKIMNNLDNALEKAIINNNEELINNTIKLMNTSH